MAGSNKITGFGLRALFVYTLDTNLFPSGDESGTLGYNGDRVDGISSLTPTLPSGQVINAIGDDRPVASFYQAPTTEPTFAFTSVISNLAADAIFGGNTVRTIGDGQHLPYFTNKQGNEPRLAIIAQREAQITDPASPRKGATQWQTVYMNNAVVTKTGQSFEQQAAETDTYNAVLTNTTRAFWHQDYTEVDDGATQAVFGIFHTDNPLAFEFFQSDGTASVYTLTDEPISVAKTVAYVNGTAQTVTAVGTTAPYTISGTFAAGNMAVIFETATER